MWHTKVQVCSEYLSVNVALGASMVGSRMVPVNSSCVLGRRRLAIREGTRWRSLLETRKFDLVFSIHYSDMEVEYLIDMLGYLVC